MTSPGPHTRPSSRRPSSRQAKKSLRRGRKPIFSEAQKKVLGKMISKALRASLKKLVKAS